MDLLRSLEKNIVAGSLVALSLVVFMGVVPLLSIQRLVSSEEQVRSVVASVERLETTLSHLKDAETGTRGFIITGKTAFLEPYQSSLRQLEQDLAILPKALQHSGNSTEHLPRLHTLINQKLLIFQQIIERRKKEELLHIAQLQQIEEGKRLMDEIRALVSLMQAQERSLLSTRESQNAQLFIVSKLIVLGGSVLAFLSVLLLVIVVRRDVAKRRQVEQQLLNSEQLLNDAQRIAKMGSWEYDVEKDQLLASDSLYQIFEVGSAKHELETSAQFYQRVHSQDVQQLSTIYNYCIETGESFQTEYRLSLPGGKQKHILSYINPLKEADGKVKKVYGTCQDISELKLAQEALIKSEKLFSTIFQLSPFPTAITRLWDGKIIVANNKSMEVFGYNAKEISNSTTVELKLWHNLQEREVFVQQIKAEKILIFEKRYQTREDKFLDAITYIELIEWEQEPCLLIILQDITERKKAEEAINAYAEKLRQLNMSKDKFFSIIAHDLLSPLNGVLGSADLLANHFNSLREEEIQKLSQGIHSSTQHLKRLLTNLLEWARMQKGELSFSPKIVNLYKVTTEELASFSDNCLQKNVVTELLVGEDLLIEADEHMLRTVIRNLIANAIKFSNKGGTIHINSEQSETDIKICVRDTGIGMNKHVQENLFQVAEKQSSIGTAGEKGTGLGLVLCKEFIERHGGHIRVESEVNKGTVFTLVLPRHPLPSPY